MERENLFNKKPESEFFKAAADEAAQQDKMCVLLKGFDNNERNMLLDERAFKIKQAKREHTIKVRTFGTYRLSASAARASLVQFRDAQSLHGVRQAVLRRTACVWLSGRACLSHGRAGFTTSGPWVTTHSNSSRGHHASGTASA